MRGAWDTETLVLEAAIAAAQRASLEQNERIIARNRGIMATRLRRFEDAEEMRWQLSRYRHIGPFEGLEDHQEIDQ